MSVALRCPKHAYCNFHAMSIFIFKNYSSFKNRWKSKYNLFSCV